MDWIRLNELLRHNLLGLLYIAWVPALLFTIIGLTRYGRRVPWPRRFARACWWTALFGVAMAFVGEITCANLLGREFQCNRNERAMAMSLRGYAQDYDDTLPPATGWNTLSRSYVVPREPPGFDCPRTGYRFGYALSSRMGGADLNKVDRLHEVLLLFDHKAKGPNDTAPRISLDLLDHHDRFVNAVAADGHTARYGRSRIQELGW